MVSVVYMKGCSECFSFPAYVPYCSSDVYTGTKYRTEGDEGFYFHGHYIINAIMDDLIENTWITEAEEVSSGCIFMMFTSKYFPRLC